MALKEDLIEAKKEIQELKKQSFAMEFVKDYKIQSKRLFIIWLITFITLGILTIYTISLLNDIEVVEDTKNIDIQDVHTIDNSHIKIGDDIWEKSK